MATTVTGTFNYTITITTGCSNTCENGVSLPVKSSVCPVCGNSIV